MAIFGHNIKKTQVKTLIHKAQIIFKKDKTGYRCNYLLFKCSNLF